VALRIEEDPLQTSSQPLHYFNIYAIDSKGRIVPDATDEITVQVSGAATFVALDNGDHYTDDLFHDVTTKRMHTGYMQCILRGARKAGKATVTVTSPTLKGAKHVFFSPSK
jgi:beta-galactosidase